ncbi:MAG: NUDIX domain-containing protein [Gammaproteobacteria bacterium]|nr:NUDIX domain-containing protein [Gammaproteobacteria bacterium]
MKKLNAQDVNLHQEKTAYKGFFTIKQYTLQHPLFQGGHSQPLIRECFERGHAVGVLAYDPWLDTLILLEQFRIGAYVNHIQNPWLLEIIAGIVESGESHTEVAHREAQEEAGLTLLALEPIANFYSSPGGTSETTQLYCACVDSHNAGGFYGLEEEGEDIRLHVVSYDEAVQLLKEGALNNASAMIAMQWLMLNKEDLRRKWKHL